MPSTDFRGADLSDSLADRAVFVDANFEDAVLVSVEREREGEIFNPGARARARAGRLARFTHRHTHTNTLILLLLSSPPATRRFHPVRLGRRQRGE